MYSKRSPSAFAAGIELPNISIPANCGITPSTGFNLLRRYSSMVEDTATPLPFGFIGGFLLDMSISAKLAVQAARRPFDGGRALRRYCGPRGSAGRIEGVSRASSERVSAISEFRCPQ